MSQNSKFIHKSHNVTILLYHLVSSAKYRRVVISDSVDRVLVETCAEIEKRYEVFLRCPEVKKQLWGGEFWGKGYFVNTVGQHGTENVIAKYVKEQGIEKDYKVLKKDYQLKLF